MTTGDWAGNGVIAGDWIEALWLWLSEESEYCVILDVVLWAHEGDYCSCVSFQLTIYKSIHLSLSIIYLSICCICASPVCWCKWLSMILAAASSPLQSITLSLTVFLTHTQSVSPSLSTFLTPFLLSFLPSYLPLCLPSLLFFVRFFLPWFFPSCFSPTIIAWPCFTLLPDCLFTSQSMSTIRALCWC